MSEWKKVKLGEIANIKTGKLDSNAAVTNGLYPFFTCDPNTLRINEWAYDTEAVLLAGNNASGNYTAKYYIGKFNAYQRTYIIESSNTFVTSTRFLAYAMNMQLQRLKVMSSGSTTKFITMKMLTSLEIPHPSIETQHRIATILSRYDSLIENYLKQIKLLEEAAQRLYKEWFVELRFPGHENTKMVDGLPEGWERKKLVDVAKLKAGGDKPKAFSNEKTEELTVPVFSNGTVNEGLYGYTNVAEVNEPSVTVSARGSIGFTVMRRMPYVPIVRLISIIPINVYIGYLYLYIKGMPLDGNGAAQQQITVPMIKDIVILMPSNLILKMFEENVEPLYIIAETLKNQIRLLTEARDRLLPRLMGGKMEV